MTKYDVLEPEFIKGYVNGEWKSVNQFAITKGINTNSGHFKSKTKGWVKKAQQFILDNSNEAKELARIEIVKDIQKDWERIYKNLGDAAINISEMVKDYTDQKNKYFIIVDRDGNEKIDIASFKGVMEAGLNALKLHRGTYTSEDTPMSIDSLHKIEESKKIKENEKPSSLTINNAPIKIEIVGIDPEDEPKN